MLSLLDVAHKQVVSWHIVFGNREGEYWWNSRLKPGFQHVQAWRDVRYGKRPDDVLWLRVDPFAAMTHVGIEWDPAPPWRQDKSLTVVRVSAAARAYKVRELFSIGPFSCVEHMKALLGIRSFWLRTPWQLYKHIRKHNGVLIS